MSENNVEIFIESDKSSFDSGISTTEKDNNIINENIINYNEILENLNAQKIFYDELRKRLSQLTDRRAKKKKFELCNICFAQLDTEDIKTCTPCCQCEKSICRGKNCSYWIPKLGKWECQLCNLSNASQSRTKEWINKQVKNENEIYHPIRARSELNIPILDDKLSTTQSLNHIPTCSPASSISGLNLHREEIRNHVEEILADMLGGSLDNISVGPMSKNKQYYNLFTKYHKHLSEKLYMLENTIKQLNLKQSHYNYHNINNNHNHHQCNHQYNNFNNGNRCQSLPYKDLPLWESNSTNNLDTNNPTNISHFKLKRLIERIVEETLRIPQITEFSDVPSHLSSSDNHLQLQHQNFDRRQKHRSSSRRCSKTSHTDDYDNYNEMYENNPQYFDPKRYQELLATAVLNKIVDTCATEKKSIDSNKIRNIDNNHNKIIITKELCDASSSSSSHDPRSESSLPDPIQNVNVDDINVRLYADILNENFDRESILSDSLATNKNIPEIISSDNDSIEDFVSVASGADSTWEENWLFKKRKLATHPTGSIGMLVPAPREDIKAMIGDRSADEISDFSENEDDGYGNDNRNDSGPENDRIQNKTVIGGQNTVGLFDDLMEQTSLISKCSSSADNESYIETTNDYVDFKYGLNVKEEPSLDLTCGGIPLKTEAVNAAIGVNLFRKEVPTVQIETEKDNNIEISEPIIYTQPTNIDSEVPEPNQLERNNPNANHQQRRHSTIEFLAAIALGPVLTVCSPDINEDILKTITNKTDVVSLLTQTENINIEIEEEQYFDVEVLNRPDIPCSPSIEATESGISTPNLKQINSGYETPESGISTPILRQSPSGTPTDSGKISPTSKQVRFNENPTVINKRKRNRTIYDSELNASLLNESLIANVFVDHIMRAAENKKIDNSNEDEIPESYILDNNDLTDCMENVSSSKKGADSFILPSDVLTQISTLLSDIDLGSLKDDLIRSVSPIPFDNEFDIFICPPPPNFDIDVLATSSSKICDINRENKNTNSENISKEILTSATKTEPIATESLKSSEPSTVVLENCKLVENVTTKPETQPTKALENQNHVKEFLTAVIENESANAEQLESFKPMKNTSMMVVTLETTYKNNKLTEEITAVTETELLETESIKTSEPIENTAATITENEEPNQVAEIETPIAKLLEYSKLEEDTPTTDKKPPGNSKTVNDTLTANVEAEPLFPKSLENSKDEHKQTAVIKTEAPALELLESSQEIKETSITVAETEMLILAETTSSTAELLEKNKSVENTITTSAKTEIQIAVSLDNIELIENSSATIAETESQTTETLENCESVENIKTKVVTTKAPSLESLQNNILIKEISTVVSETEGFATEEIGIKTTSIERLQNSELMQETATSISEIEPVSKKLLEDSKLDENIVALPVEIETPVIKLVENNKLIENILSAAEETKPSVTKCVESNKSFQKTTNAETETQVADPKDHGKLVKNISITAVETEPHAVELLKNSKPVEVIQTTVVKIEPLKNDSSENNNSIENSSAIAVETPDIEPPDIEPLTNSNLIKVISVTDAQSKPLALDSRNSVEYKTNAVVQTITLAEESFEYNKTVRDTTTTNLEIEPLASESLENSKDEEDRTSTPVIAVLKIVNDSVVKSVENTKIIQQISTAVAEIEQFTNESLESSKSANNTALEIVKTDTSPTEPLRYGNVPTEIVETDPQTLETLQNGKPMENISATVVQTVNGSGLELLANTTLIQETSTAVVETEHFVKKLIETNKSVEITATAVVETVLLTTDSFENSKPVDDAPTSIVKPAGSSVSEPLENTTVIQETSTTKLAAESLESSESIENTKTAVVETETQVLEPLEIKKLKEEITMTIVGTELPPTKPLEKGKSVEDSTTRVVKGESPVPQEASSIVGEIEQSCKGNTTVIDTESETPQPPKCRDPTEVASTAIIENESSTTKTLKTNNVLEEISMTVEETEQSVTQPFKYSKPMENTKSEVVNTEEKISPTTVTEAEPLRKELLQSREPVQDIHTAIAETESPDSDALENSKPDNDTFIKLAEIELPATEPLKSIKPLNNIQSAIANETLTATTENESPSEETSQISKPEHYTSAEIAETKKPTAKLLENTKIIEKTSTAITESSSTIIKQSEVIELDKSLLLGMILPPPVEFQNIANDESPTSLNMSEEIEPIVKILEVTTLPKDVLSDPKIALTSKTNLNLDQESTKLIAQIHIEKFPLANSELTVNEQPEQNKLIEETLCKPVDTNSEILKSIKNRDAAKEFESTVLKITSLLETDLPSKPLEEAIIAITETERDVTETLENIKLMEDTKTSVLIEKTTREPLQGNILMEDISPINVLDTPQIFKNSKSKTTRSTKNIELSEDTLAAAAEEEPPFEKSNFIEETLTVVDNTEATVKELLEISKQVKETSSIIAESELSTTQSSENPEPLQNTSTKVIESEAAELESVKISSSVANAPRVVIENATAIKEELENNNTVKDTTTVETYPQFESSEKVAEIELTFVETIAVVDNKLHTDVGLVEDTSTAVIQREHLNIEVSGTQSSENSDPPKDTSTKIIENESQSIESLAISSSVKNDSTVVIEIATATEEHLENNNTVEDTPTVETYTQFESSEIVAEIETTVIESIVVLDNKLDTNVEMPENTRTPVVEREPSLDTSKVKEATLTVIEDAEATAKESIEINKRVEESSSFTAEPESPSAQQLENPDPPEDTSIKVIESETPSIESLAISSSVKNDPTVVIEITTATKEHLDNNNTVEDSPTVEIYTQLESSEIFAEIETTVVESIVVLDNLNTNVEMPENTRAPAVEREPSLDTSKVKEATLTVIEDTEATANESIEINKRVEESSSIIAETESPSTQQLENPEPPEGTLTKVIEIETPSIESLAISSSVKNDPTVVIEITTATKEHLDNNNTVEDSPAVEIYTQLESSEIVAEIETTVVESIVVLDNLDTNVEMPENTRAPAVEREPSLYKSKVKEATITVIDDTEATAKESIEIKKRVEESSSIIAETESPSTQQLENPEPPEGTLTKVIEIETPSIESLAISSSVKNDPTVVIEITTATKEHLYNNNTVEDSPAVEIYTQLESSEIVAEIETTVVESIVVLDNLDTNVEMPENTRAPAVEREPSLYKSKVKEATITVIDDTEATAKESIEINKRVEESSSIIAETESPSTQQLENPEPPEDTSTKVIESETPSIESLAISSSVKNDPTVVKEIARATKEELENNNSVTDSPTVVVYPQLESSEIVSEIESTVVESNAITDQKLDTSVELVVSNRVEDMTTAIAKPELLVLESPTSVVIEAASELTKSIPVEYSKAEAVENHPVGKEQFSVSEEKLEINQTLTYNKPLEDNTNSKCVENVAVSVAVTEPAVPKEISVPETKLEICKPAENCNPIENTIAAPEIKIDTTNISENSDAVKSITAASETKKVVPDLKENCKNVEDTTTILVETETVVEVSLENSKPLENLTSKVRVTEPSVLQPVSSLEAKLEIIKPLKENQNIENAIIAAPKTNLDNTENNEFAENTSDAVPKNQESVSEPEATALGQTAIPETKSGIEISDKSANNMQQQITTTAIKETKPGFSQLLGTAEDTITAVEKYDSLPFQENNNSVKEETKVANTVPMVSEILKENKPLQTTKTTTAEIKPLVIQPSRITEIKLEIKESNEPQENVSLSDIVIVKEQTITTKSIQNILEFQNEITNTISDVDISKHISTTDSIDEIIITLPTAAENNIINSDIGNIEITDLIIPPPFDFASEDNSETPKNDASIPIQASHNTSQIELINDFVENNSKILDTEIMVINNNITTSSTNSETIPSNDLANNSGKNLENILKLSASSTQPYKSPSQDIFGKESTQIVLETIHNSNISVENSSINKELSVIEIPDNQSIQISKLNESASITESLNLTEINPTNKNPPNETILEETNNPDFAIQDKTNEMLLNSPCDSKDVPNISISSEIISNMDLQEARLQCSTNTTSNLDTDAVIGMKHTNGNSTNLEVQEYISPPSKVIENICSKESNEFYSEILRKTNTSVPVLCTNEITSKNENNLISNGNENSKIDDMQQNQSTQETSAAIKSFKKTENSETPANISNENILSEEISNVNLANPPLPVIRTQNIEEISLEQQINTTISDSIFESNETTSTEIKKEDDETSSENQRTKELKSERTSSDSTDESTHTILDATEEAQILTTPNENLINQSPTQTYINGNENENPTEESLTSTLKTSITSDTDTDDIVMLHDENFFNMEINDSNLTDNQILNVTINNDNIVQNLTENITLNNTNSININDNTNNNNINTNTNSNPNSETNFINKIFIANPNNETNFINKIIYSGDGNNVVLNYSNAQNEIINQLVSEKIEPTLGTNTLNITPKLIDTKNTEAFCKTLDISDDDDEQNNNNLIPGSIAEREHKKWYNAVEMPNNPYAPEALLRRLDSRPEVLFDIPQRHVSNNEIPSPGEEEEEIINAVKLNPKKIDLSIYSRDYYVPITKTNSSKNKLIKMSCFENDQQLQQQSLPTINDDKELLNKCNNEEQKLTKPISDEIEQIIYNNEQSIEQPINVTCDNKIILNSTSSEHNKNENIFSAKLIQINDLTDDEQSKSIIELSLTSDKLKADSSPSDISLANSLTLSEDSDTLRVYNLNKQETTFILKENQQQQQQQELKLTETSPERYFSDITNTPPNTPITPTLPKVTPRAPRIRPTELNLQQISSQSPTGGKTAMVLTPQSFKFLHPKRKIIEPSQILTQEQYTTPPETPDKTVIEEEIVHTLPSVKALAKAFLLTQGKLSEVHNLNVRPKSLIVETTSDKFEAKDQIKKTISHENLALPTQKVTNDAIKQDENQNNITISERSLSPVLLTQGKLKDNIAFFENLKKN